jgi:hypothetical protein
VRSAPNWNERSLYLIDKLRINFVLLMQYSVKCGHLREDFKELVQAPAAMFSWGVLLQNAVSELSV